MNEIPEVGSNKRLKIHHLFRGIETAQNGIVRDCRSKAQCLIRRIKSKLSSRSHQPPLLLGPQSNTSYNEVSNNPLWELNATAERELTAASTKLRNTTTKSNRLNAFSFLNIQGNQSKTVQSKVPYVENILEPKNQLFIGVTETWFKEHKDSEVNIEGYTVFRADKKREKKKGRDSGGVAFYVRNDLAANMQTNLSYTNGVIECLCLYSVIQNLLLIVVYRQPDDAIHRHPSNTTHFNELLHSLTEKNESSRKSSPRHCLRRRPQPSKF